jgi:hypothetical protein
MEPAVSALLYAFLQVHINLTPLIFFFFSFFTLLWESVTKKEAGATRGGGRRERRKQEVGGRARSVGNPRDPQCQNKPVGGG